VEDRQTLPGRSTRTRRSAEQISEGRRPDREDLVDIDRTHRNGRRSAVVDGGLRPGSRATDDRRSKKLERPGEAVQSRELPSTPIAHMHDQAGSFPEIQDDSPQGKQSFAGDPPVWQYPGRRVTWRGNRAPLAASSFQGR